jgi:hypothetical protein
VDAEHPGEQRSWQVSGELEQRGGTGLRGADAELTETSGELVGADRASWLAAGEQPPRDFLAADGGMAVPGGDDLQDQGVKRLREDDRLAAQPDPDAVSAGLNMAAMTSDTNRSSGERGGQPPCWRWRAHRW